MAGHSKWSQIKRKKALTDQKRGQVFTRHAQLIALTAKRGSNPDMNPSLRSAIDRAKVDNTPKTVIERAIAKGSGQLQGRLDDVVYDVFGPSGTVFLAQASTDNQNRTRTDIHTACMKSDARLGERGSAIWMFTCIGEIVVESELDEDDELELIEAGVEDVVLSRELACIETSSDQFGSIMGWVHDRELPLHRAGLIFRANDPVTLDKDQFSVAESLREALEELEDIESVFVNYAYSGD